MKKLSALFLICLVLAPACTTVDVGHQTRSGKKAYASKAPRNRSAWK